MIVDELRELIFTELPSKWGWIHKSDAAETILAPLRRHIAQLLKESAETDQAIDRLCNEKQELRDALDKLLNATHEAVGHNYGSASYLDAISLAEEALKNYN